jgi:protease-4
MARAGRRWGLWLFLLVVIVVVVVMAYQRRLPSNSVLLLEVGGEIAEQSPPGVAAQLTGAQPHVLHKLMDAIRHAADDRRIRGLALKITPLDTGAGKIQELREAITEFRRSGKPTLCYMQADEITNNQLWLASACEHVWSVPTAPLGLTGMMTSTTFLRGTLDKLGIYPDLYSIAEFKNARDRVTDKSYTPAHRQNLEGILRSRYEQFLNQVSASRNMDRDAFQQLVERGPYLTSEALEHKLVDRAAYWDEMQDFFKQHAGDWKPVRLARYSREVRSEGRQKVAIVHATGNIVVGQSDYSPVLGFMMGSDSVAADLRRAREDDSIKAVVLRVDSGGGSAVASEIIRREVELIRRKKPVVASMSDVAASGGYWISMSSSRILADPGTITGSIGVVYGKANVRGLYSMLGLSVDHIALSDNATIGWSQQNYTPRQRETILRMMQQIYDDFIAGVAAGRNLAPERVNEIGRGRVWTGQQALDLGLIDEVGGMERAVAVAKELAGIAPDVAVERVRFPLEKPLWQRLLDFGGSQASLGQVLAAERARLLHSEPLQVRMPAMDLR